MSGETIRWSAVAAVVVLGIVRHAVVRNAETEPPTRRVEALAKAKKVSFRLFAAEFVLMAGLVLSCILDYAGVRVFSD